MTSNTFGTDFDKAALLSALEAAYNRAALKREQYEQFLKDIKEGTFDYEAARRVIKNLP